MVGIAQSLGVFPGPVDTDTKMPYPLGFDRPERKARILLRFGSRHKVRRNGIRMRTEQVRKSLKGGAFTCPEGLIGTELPRRQNSARLEIGWSRLRNEIFHGRQV